MLRRVEQGEQIVIARDGRPVATLSPFAPLDDERPSDINHDTDDQPPNGDAPPRRRRPPPGVDKGRVWMAPDFDAPLPEFEEWEERSIFPDIPDAK
jgi:antitoxin (DNA-binding transcriptional repressor) of toxin-antitoxin stability system